MIHNLTLACGVVLVAGLINGSFASPIFFIKDWKEENSWFIYGIWAFLVLPILTILLLQPSALLTFKHLTLNQMTIVLLGGFAFGTGQIFLATAFRCIGIGVSFIINIGLGMILTSVFSLAFSANELGGNYYYFRMIASLLIITSILVIFFSMLNKREKDNKKQEGFQKIFTGTVCAIVAGLGSGAQGLAFVYVNKYIVAKSMALYSVDALTGAILTWVLIFVFSSIPFLLYFLYKLINNQTFACFKTPQAGKNVFLTLCMGLCFWLSLAFLARVNSYELKQQGAQTIIWAIFMIFIVLTSTFWSFRLSEWRNSSYSSKAIVWLSVLIFIVSILIISLSINLGISASVFGV